MKRGLCSIVAVGALLFCRYDSTVNPETYSQIEGIMDRGETIAGAELVGLGGWGESGAFEVDLLNATPRQLEEARAMWPGVRFSSGVLFDMSPGRMLP
jgi:hypothetical protein